MNKHSIAHCLLVLFLYFGVYVLILPSILTRLTLMMNPNASAFHPGILFTGYLGFMILMMWVCRDCLKTGLRKIIDRPVKFIVYTILGILMILAVNILLSLVVAWLFSTSSSMNQQNIETQVVLQPYLMVFVTCMFAPIVEECVFRGSVYQYLSVRWNEIAAMLISSAMFGFIHVMSSISSGSVAEIGYFFLYMFMGFVLSYAYKKTDTIYSSIIIHTINNGFAILMMYL